MHKYNGFVTLNASAIKNVMTCLKGNSGLPKTMSCYRLSAAALTTVPNTGNRLESRILLVSINDPSLEVGRRVSPITLPGAKSLLKSYWTMSMCHIILVE